MAHITPGRFAADTNDDIVVFLSGPGYEHLPAWRAFNRAIKGNGNVGIWHETYGVGAGKTEAIYSNMHDFGLAAARRS